MKKKEKITANELFMYFMFIDEYKNDLFVPCKKGCGSYMPTKNEPHWYAVPWMFFDDLNFVPYLYKQHQLWEWIREMWKTDDPAVKWDYAKRIAKDRTWLGFRI